MVGVWNKQQKALGKVVLISESGEDAFWFENHVERTGSIHKKRNPWDAIDNVATDEK